jgi:hypothetical protein
VRLVERPTPGDSVGIVSNIAADAGAIGGDATVMSR